MTTSKSREMFRPERLLAFSDGVFGVTITLLVIDLKLPSLPPESSDAALLQAIFAMRSNLFIFAFTFLIIGMSWLGHHRKFSYIHEVDGWLLWMNLLYLMALCLVPFASSVLSEYDSRFGLILYAAVMILLDTFSAMLCAYGLRQPFVRDGDLPPHLRRALILSPLLTAVVFLISAGLALGGRVAYAHWSLLLIVPVMAFFGSRSRTHHARSAPGHVTPR